MDREFIYVSHFIKKWENLGLSIENLRLLELYIMENPNAGAVIQGTGGLRKLRWALPNTGKSGSIRVLYVDFVYHEKVFFIDLFSKNQKSNISHLEKNNIKKVIIELERGL